MYKPETAQPELCFSKSTEKFFIIDLISITEKYNMYLTPPVNEKGYFPVYFMGNLGQGLYKLTAY